jgi:hypothetical protein
MPAVCLDERRSMNEALQHADGAIDRDAPPRIHVAAGIVSTAGFSL